MIDVTIIVHEEGSQTEKILSVDLTKSNGASYRASDRLRAKVAYSAMIADDQKRQLCVIIPASPNKQAL